MPNTDVTEAGGSGDKHVEFCVMIIIVVSRVTTETG